MMKRYRAILVTAVSMVNGCAHSVPASSPPEPVSTPEAEPGLPNPSSSTGLTWHFTPTADVRSYSSVVTTILTDTDHTRRDSLLTQTSYSISTSRSRDSLVYSGLIKTYEVKGTISLPESLSFAQAVPFSGIITNHRMSNTVAGHFSNTEQNQCADLSQTPIRAIERNLFFIPLTLTTNQEWTDSTSSIVCSGSLPLNLTTLRTFRVIGEKDYQGTSALAVDLNERTFSKGEGSQEQHQIRVESEGQTKALLYIDASSGKLLGSNSTNKTLLTIQSSGRAQRFVENSTEVTTRDR